MTQPLSVYEKQALLKRFDLSDLSASDQQAFQSLLFDYLNEFSSVGWKSFCFPRAFLSISA